MIIYKKLTNRIKSEGFTLRTFAQEIGVNHKCIELISTNKPIKTTTIDAICTYYKCQPNDIMEWIDENA